LRRNKLASLQGDTFKNLEKLKQLSLNENSIKKFDEKAFSGLVNLGHLDLGNNELNGEISFGTDLKKLETLNVYDNKLELLRASFFKGFGLAVLRVLDFSNNFIKNIDDDTFSGQTNLKELNLAGNKLENILPNLFENLISVKKLRLARNKLVSLNADVFRHLKKLTVLHVEQLYQDDR
jgi:Leucine-rich repeat (LRR) protein